MTLVEVLVAVTVFSLLVAGMASTLQMGINAMDVSNRRITANRKAWGAQRILTAQMAGFLPVRALCGSLPELNQFTNQAFPYFDGRPSAMHFVSRYSLAGASRGMPSAVELFIAPGDNGEGVRLLVNETPYNGPVGLGRGCLPPAPDVETGLPGLRFPPAQARPGTFVLADRLAYCRFLYLDSPENAAPAIWRTFWGFQDRLPSAIRIEMGPLAGDAGRIPPVTFTAPIRAKLPPAEEYAPR
jgi:type II secretory pathway pseudopilin PulG